MNRERRKACWQERLKERAAAVALSQITSRLVIELDREGARDLLEILAASIERLRDEEDKRETLARGDEIRRQLALLDKLFEGVDSIVAHNGWRRASLDEL